VVPVSDGVPEDIEELAREYLESLGTDNEAADPEEAREELEYWQEQVDEFAEGSPMHEMAVEERDDAREALDVLDSQDERREALREAFLQRAAMEFAPKGGWLTLDVLKALSHALTGTRREELLVGEFRLPVDGPELSKREMVTVAKTVQAVASDATGDDERIAAVWDTLDTDTRISIARALVNEDGPLPSGRISDKLGEDGTDNPGANIRYLKKQTEIMPFFSSDDGYALSLVGRYLLSEYAPDVDEAGNDEDEDEASGVEESGDEPLADEVQTDDEQDKTADLDLSSFQVRD
jgi:hypothetical protein